jgi:hypothetical protein
VTICLLTEQVIQAKIVHDPTQANCFRHTQNKAGGHECDVHSSAGEVPARSVSIRHRVTCRRLWLQLPAPANCCHRLPYVLASHHNVLKGRQSTQDGSPLTCDRLSPIHNCGQVDTIAAGVGASALQLQFLLWPIGS